MKTIRKYLLLFCLWTVFCPLNSATNSSPGPISEINQQLRSIFSGLINPYPDVNFFYDLSAHLIDSAYYSAKCPLPTNCDLWYYTYKELMWCSLDTTILESDSIIYQRANEVGADTVFIGILDFKYLTLDSSSISSGEYFYVDTINNILSSRPVDQRPAYKIGEIFMSSPIVPFSHTQQVTFAIDPNFLFIDRQLYEDITSYCSCHIDFDDGQGWQPVNLTAVKFFDISYPISGMKKIKTIVVDNQRSDTIKSSTSEFFVGDLTPDSELSYTDRTAEFQGLYVYEFAPNCSNGMTDQEKYVFILSGYNAQSFARDRTVSELYKKYIIAGHRDDLLDFGYKIIIVDYEDPNRPIQDNAAFVIQLLEDYKCSLTTNEQFVVIGESMGGLIGRYALTQMEAPNYISSCASRASQRHNTRLFITNDTPHLGANIPLSIQEIYGIILDRPTVFGTMKDLVNVVTLGAWDFRKKALDGSSVKQMLLYHYQTRNNENYEAHPLRNDFISSLQAIGDYPKKCKIVALSNGSLSGVNQQQCYNPSDAGQFRRANDVLFDLNTYAYFRLFGFRFSTSLFVDLKTNPDGDGNLLMLDAKRDRPKFTLKPWGFNVHHRDTNDIIIINGRKLLPYCTSPGGAIYLGEDHYYGNYKPLGINIQLGVLGIDYDARPGHMTFRSYFGIPWIYEIGLGFDAYSDGFGFTLVPIHSALNYNEPLDLNRDYTQIPIRQLFASTPFDVLGGRFSADNSHRYNGNHEDYRNIVFYNAETRDTTYSLECGKSTRILNREVGDAELYLDCDTVSWPSEYSILGPIYTNQEHPYYDFEGKTDYTFGVPGMYTRNTPYVVQPSISVQFNRTRAGKIKDVDSYQEKQFDWYNCCEDSVAKTPQRQKQKNEEDFRQDNVTIYPNPVDHTSATITINATEATNLRLYNIHGAYIYSQKLIRSLTEQCINLPENIMPGSYIVEVAGEKTTRHLLILQ